MLTNCLKQNLSTVVLFKVFPDKMMFYAKLIIIFDSLYSLVLVNQKNNCEQLNDIMSAVT